MLTGVGTRKLRGPAESVGGDLISSVVSSSGSWRGGLVEQKGERREGAGKDEAEVQQDLRGEGEEEE